VFARDVPGSSGFKEAVDGVKFTALRSSPTVSGGLWDLIIEVISI
jgi:hypothetical protein